MPEPRAGVGLGLRWEFMPDVVASERRLPVDFFELAPENYLGRGGYYAALLERLHESYPITLHGLTLSIGGSEPLELGYLHDVLERSGAGLLLDLNNAFVNAANHGGDALEFLQRLPLPDAAPRSRSAACSWPSWCGAARSMHPGRRGSLKPCCSTSAWRN